MKKIKIFGIIALLLLAFTCACTLTGCNDDDDDYDPYYGGNDYGDDDTKSAGADLFGGSITEELAYEIYSVMDSHSFEDYINGTYSGDEWNSYSGAVKTELFENVSAMANDLGLGYSTSESKWLDKMSQNVGSYSFWGSAFISLSLNYGSQDKLENYVSIFHYVKGIEEGKYSPLHPEILAAADSLTVEYYIGSYLLCIGGSHNISQITYEAMTDESGIYYESGSVTAVDGADIFGDDNHSYTISGGDGAIESASFGDAELAYVFRAIGAVDGNGIMMNDQIQISAISTFNAPVLYIHTQDDSGLITVAPVRYNKSEKVYDWDGEMFTTQYRTCFNKSGVFCYIDENGILQQIS